MEHRIRLRLREKIMETDRAATLVLEPVNGPVTYRAGQFLTFIFTTLGPAEVRRSYSISSAPGVDSHLAVTVQKVVNGAVSRYLVDASQPGDEFVALAPAGRFFPSPAGKARDIFLIGGGSGVTPLFSLLKFLLSQDPLSHVVLIDANRNEEQIIFRDALLSWAERYPDRFHGLLFLSDPLSPAPELRRQLAPLLVQRARLGNSLLEELTEQYLFHDPDNAEFFLCGPAGLLIKGENTLGYLGFSPARIHREIFTIRQPYRPPAALFPASEVLLHAKGKHYSFPVAGGQTILEAAQKAGIHLPYSCLSGSCTTCSCQCLSGKVDMYTQDGHQDTVLTRGLTLTCVGYPATPQIELEFQ